MNRKNLRAAASFGYYLVEITEWGWSYNFGVVSARFAERHFDEQRHLRVRGRLLAPRTVAVKSAELIFLPNVPAALMETVSTHPPELDAPPPPPGVGALHIRDASLIGHLEMPKDALDPVLQMLEAGRLRFVALDGEAMRYNKCLIRHYEIKGRDEGATKPNAAEA